MVDPIAKFLLWGFILGGTAEGQTGYVRVAEGVRLHYRDVRLAQERGGDVGEHDLQIGARDWADALPNAKLVVLPDVRHFPREEDRAQFFDAMNRFLAQVSTR